MAVTPIKFYVPTAIDTLFAHAALKNLANGAELTSDALTSNLDMVANLIMAVSWATAPAVGVTAFEVYLLPAVDGTNYPSVGADGLPQKSLLIGSLESRLPTTNALEYLVLRNIRFDPGTFKILISNTSAQATANDDDVSMFCKLQRWQIGSGSA